MRCLSIILLLLCFRSIAQSDTLNQKDKDGNKQGYWIIYGNMKPDKGYCDSCKVEEGVYVDDQYDGVWTKYHLDGKTPRLVVTYDKGQPHGMYKKISDEGKLLEKGNINGQSQQVLEGYYFCGRLQYTKNYNENDQEDGSMHYYFNSCDCKDSSLKLLQKVEVKRNGVLVDTTYEFYRSGCPRAVIVYGEAGKIIKKDYFRDTCTVDMNSAYQRCYSDMEPKADPNLPVEEVTSLNGFKRLHNANDDILLEGEFKEGKLWKGKKYVYKADGSLETIEIWKKGKFKKKAKF